MPGQVITRNRRSSQDVSAARLGMIINVAANAIPKLWNQLPLVQEPRFLTVQQDAWLDCASLSRLVVNVQANLALCSLSGGLSFATSAWPFHENSAADAQT